ncbi:hypothetical protein LTR10_021930 [Elasticomyces elasticus]|uniref:Uncharacterized protein n=1 Tax=Exophiala sideris TaxID=1016849 RepID=A0ABR0IX66_9EURO|nr:hypothetical protein LTR10_021930 [Elasticomyces elasticus]KAK5021838.1 hypothetical protein LTS07_010579 [Exophiala sideris]KAK5025903.1 hypothetical protein LTR13_010216 [Exophiala sideris]KAK5050268.1 hypothetical protein LTR69_010603 [Exophiala sideris]KAK5177127.1 hypothetical protein LTR44_010411 [Eurotiomycetes sp. CCFEE 6388]
MPRATMIHYEIYTPEERRAAAKARMKDTTPARAEPYVTLKMGGNPGNGGKPTGDFAESLWAKVEELANKHSAARVAAEQDNSTSDNKPVAPKPSTHKSNSVSNHSALTHRAKARDEKQEESKAPAAEVQDNWTMVNKRPGWVKVEHMEAPAGIIDEEQRDAETLVEIAHNTDKAIPAMSPVTVSSFRNILRDMKNGIALSDIAYEYYGSSSRKSKDAIDLLLEIADFAIDRDMQVRRLEAEFAKAADWEMTSRSDVMES